MAKIQLNLYQQHAIEDIIEKYHGELLIQVTRLIDDELANIKAELLNELQDMSEYG